VVEVEALGAPDGPKTGEDDLPSWMALQPTPIEQRDKRSRRSNPPPMRPRSPGSPRDWS
jgi:hypothetical protein